ncbi:MAG: hypothetical protein LBJ18_03730 [Rickettsiales bacterium]|jgi:lysozyme family protein|nr:hypothetical protein [Rickettsiales bacterium]
MSYSENFTKSLKPLLAAEGGYVCRASDTGGQTYAGITRRDNPGCAFWSQIDDICTKMSQKSSNGTDELARTINKVLSVNQRAQSEIAECYHARYWLPANCDSLPWPICAIVFSTAVNCGTVPAKKILQQALGVVVDGNVGPKTLAAVESANQNTLKAKYCDVLTAHYQGIVSKNPAQKPNLTGWLRRVADLRKL